jgi:hypothetical protein
MLKYIKYLNYVIRHKYYVFIECWKMGILFRGLVHDLSKFRPSEFFPYAEHFYGKKIEVQKDSTGYFKSADKDMEYPDFNMAWFYHQKRNAHHWQFWITFGDYEIKLLEMPEKYVKEMVCDWKGAGKAQGVKSSVKEWYDKNKDKMKFHENTKKLIERYIYGNNW